MDEHARFEALYRAHAGAVRTYIARRSDPGGADDLVADVFVVAWRRLDQLPDEPLPWLLGVARRLLMNRRRGVARAQALARRILSEQPAPAAPPEGAAESDGAVRRALAALSERDREALVLVAWEGLEPRQAAQVVGLSANAFAARLSRARRRFARALAASRTGPERSQATARAEVVR